MLAHGISAFFGGGNSCDVFFIYLQQIREISPSFCESEKDVVVLIPLIWLSNIEGPRIRMQGGFLSHKVSL